MIANLVNNVVVDIENIHICFRHRHMCTGVALRSLHMESTDENGVPTYVKSGGPFVFKHIAMEGVSIYSCPQFGERLNHILHTNHELDVPLFKSTMRLMLRNDPFSVTSQFRDHRFILEPVGAKMKLAMRRRAAQRESESDGKSNILVELTMSAITMHITDHDYRDATVFQAELTLMQRRMQCVRFLGSFQRKILAMPVQFERFAQTPLQFERPEARPTAEPRSWWRYACTIILSKIIERRRESTWAHVLHARNTFKLYSHCYRVYRSRQTELLAAKESAEIESKAIDEEYQRVYSSDSDDIDSAEYQDHSQSDDNPRISSRPSNGNTAPLSAEETHEHLANYQSLSDLSIISILESVEAEWPVHLLLLWRMLTVEEIVREQALRKVRKNREYQKQSFFTSWFGHWGATPDDNKEISANDIESELLLLSQEEKDALVAEFGFDPTVSLTSDAQQRSSITSTASSADASIIKATLELSRFAICIHQYDGIATPATSTSTGGPRATWKRELPFKQLDQAFAVMWYDGFDLQFEKRTESMSAAFTLRDAVVLDMLTPVPQFAPVVASHWAKQATQRSAALIDLKWTSRQHPLESEAHVDLSLHAQPLNVVANFHFVSQLQRFVGAAEHIVLERLEHVASEALADMRQRTQARVLETLAKQIRMNIHVDAHAPVLFIPNQRIGRYSHSVVSESSFSPRSAFEHVHSQTPSDPNKQSAPTAHVHARRRRFHRRPSSQLHPRRSDDLKHAASSSSKTSLRDNDIASPQNENDASIDVAAAGMAVHARLEQQTHINSFVVLDLGRLLVSSPAEHIFDDAASRETLVLHKMAVSLNSEDSKSAADQVPSSELTVSGDGVVVDDTKQEAAMVKSAAARLESMRVLLLPSFAWDSVPSKTLDDVSTMFSNIGTRMDSKSAFTLVEDLSLHAFWKQTTPAQVHMCRRTVVEAHLLPVMVNVSHVKVVRCLQIIHSFSQEQRHAQYLRQCSEAAQQAAYATASGTGIRRDPNVFGQDIGSPRPFDESMRSVSRLNASVLEPDYDDAVDDDIRHATERMRSTIRLPEVTSESTQGSVSNSESMPTRYGAEASASATHPAGSVSFENQMSVTVIADAVRLRIRSDIPDYRDVPSSKRRQRQIPATKSLLASVWQWQGADTAVDIFGDHYTDILDVAVEQLVISSSSNRCTMHTAFTLGQITVEDYLQRRYRRFRHLLSTIPVSSVRDTVSTRRRPAAVATPTPVSSQSISMPVTKTTSRPSPITTRTCQLSSPSKVSSLSSASAEHGNRNDSDTGTGTGSDSDSDSDSDSSDDLFCTPPDTPTGHGRQPITLSQATDGKLDKPLVSTASKSPALRRPATSLPQVSAAPIMPFVAFSVDKQRADKANNVSEQTTVHAQFSTLSLHWNRNSISVTAHLYKCLMYSLNQIFADTHQPVPIHSPPMSPHSLASPVPLNHGTNTSSWRTPNSGHHTRAFSTMSASKLSPIQFAASPSRPFHGVGSTILEYSGDEEDEAETPHKHQHGVFGARSSSAPDTMTTFDYAMPLRFQHMLEKHNVSVSCDSSPLHTLCSRVGSLLPTSLDPNAYTCDGAVFRIAVSLQNLSVSLNDDVVGISVMEASASSCCATVARSLVSRVADIRVGSVNVSTAATRANGGAVRILSQRASSTHQDSPLLRITHTLRTDDVIANDALATNAVGTDASSISSDTTVDSDASSDSVTKPQSSMLDIHLRSTVVRLQSAFFDRLFKYFRQGLLQVAKEKAVSKAREVVYRDKLQKWLTPGLSSMRIQLDESLFVVDERQARSRVATHGQFRRRRGGSLQRGLDDHKLGVASSSNIHAPLIIRIGAVTFEKTFRVSESVHDFVCLPHMVDSPAELLCKDENGAIHELNLDYAGEDGQWSLCANSPLCSAQVALACTSVDVKDIALFWAPPGYCESICSQSDQNRRTGHRPVPVLQREHELAFLLQNTDVRYSTESPMETAGILTVRRADADAKHDSSEVFTVFATLTPLHIPNSRVSIQLSPLQLCLYDADVAHLTAMWSHSIQPLIRSVSSKPTTTQAPAAAAGGIATATATSNPVQHGTSAQQSHTMYHERRGSISGAPGGLSTVGLVHARSSPADSTLPMGTSPSVVAVASTPEDASLNFPAAQAMDASHLPPLHLPASRADEVPAPAIGSVLIIDAEQSIDDTSTSSVNSRCDSGHDSGDSTQMHCHYCEHSAHAIVCRHLSVELPSCCIILVHNEQSQFADHPMGVQRSTALNANTMPRNSIPRALPVLNSSVVLDLQAMILRFETRGDETEIMSAQLGKALLHAGNIAAPSLSSAGSSFQFTGTEFCETAVEIGSHISGTDSGVTFRRVSTPPLRQRLCMHHDTEPVKIWKRHVVPCGQRIDATINGVRVCLAPDIVFAAVMIFDAFASPVLSRSRLDGNSSAALNMSTIDEIEVHPSSPASHNQVQPPLQSTNSHARSSTRPSCRVRPQIEVNVAVNGAEGWMFSDQLHQSNSTGFDESLTTKIRRAVLFQMADVALCIHPSDEKADVERQGQLAEILVHGFECQLLPQVSTTLHGQRKTPKRIHVTLIRPTDLSIQQLQRHSDASKHIRVELSSLEMMVSFSDIAVLAGLEASWSLFASSMSAVSIFELLSMPNEQSKTASGTRGSAAPIVSSTAVPAPVQTTLPKNTNKSHIFAGDSTIDQKSVYGGGEENNDDLQLPSKPSQSSWAFIDFVGSVVVALQQWSVEIVNDSNGLPVPLLALFLEKVRIQMEGSQAAITDRRDTVTESSGSSDTWRAVRHTRHNAEATYRVAIRFFNESLHTWEPVVEPWSIQLQAEIRRQLQHGGENALEDLNFRAVADDDAHPNNSGGPKTSSLSQHTSSHAAAFGAVASSLPQTPMPTPQLTPVAAPVSLYSAASGSASGQFAYSDRATKAPTNPLLAASSHERRAHASQALKRRRHTLMQFGIDSTAFEYRHVVDVNFVLHAKEVVRVNISDTLVSTLLASSDQLKQQIETAAEASARPARPSMMTSQSLLINSGAAGASSNAPSTDAFAGSRLLETHRGIWLRNDTGCRLRFMIGTRDTSRIGRGSHANNVGVRRGDSVSVVGTVAGGGGTYTHATALLSDVQSMQHRHPSFTFVRERVRPVISRQPSSGLDSSAHDASLRGFAHLQQWDSKTPVRSRNHEQRTRDLMRARILEPGERCLIDIDSIVMESFASKVQNPNTESEQYSSLPQHIPTIDLEVQGRIPLYSSSSMQSDAAALGGWQDAWSTIQSIPLAPSLQAQYSNGAWSNGAAANADHDFHITQPYFVDPSSELVASIDASNSTFRAHGMDSIAHPHHSAGGMPQRSSASAVRVHGPLAARHSRLVAWRVAQPLRAVSHAVEAVAIGCMLEMVHAGSSHAGVSATSHSHESRAHAGLGVDPLHNSRSSTAAHTATGHPSSALAPGLVLRSSIVISNYTLIDIECCVWDQQSPHAPPHMQARAGANLPLGLDASPACYRLGVIGPGTKLPVPLHFVGNPRYRLLMRPRISVDDTRQCLLGNSHGNAPSEAVPKRPPQQSAWMDSKAQSRIAELQFTGMAFWTGATVKHASAGGKQESHAGRAQTSGTYRRGQDADYHGYCNEYSDGYTDSSEAGMDLNETPDTINMHHPLGPRASAHMRQQPHQRAQHASSSGVLLWDCDWMDVHVPLSVVPACYNEIRPRSEHELILLAMQQQQDRNARSIVHAWQLSCRQTKLEAHLFRSMNDATNRDESLSSHHAEHDTSNLDIVHMPFACRVEIVDAGSDSQSSSTAPSSVSATTGSVGPGATNNVSGEYFGSGGGRGISSSGATSSASTQPLVDIVIRPLVVITNDIPSQLDFSLSAHKTVNDTDSAASVTGTNHLYAFGGGSSNANTNNNGRARGSRGATSLSRHSHSHAPSHFGIDNDDIRSDDDQNDVGDVDDEDVDEDDDDGPGVSGAHNTQIFQVKGALLPMQQLHWHDPVYDDSMWLREGDGGLVSGSTAIVVNHSTIYLRTRVHNTQWSTDTVVLRYGNHSSRPARLGNSTEVSDDIVMHNSIGASMRMLVGHQYARFEQQASVMQSLHPRYHPNQHSDALSGDNPAAPMSERWFSLPVPLVTPVLQLRMPYWIMNGCGLPLLYSTVSDVLQHDDYHRQLAAGQSPPTIADLQYLFDEVHDSWVGGGASARSAATTSAAASAGISAGSSKHSQSSEYRDGSAYALDPLLLSLSRGFSVLLPSSSAEHRWSYDLLTRPTEQQAFVLSFPIGTDIKTRQLCIRLPNTEWSAPISLDRIATAGEVCLYESRQSASADSSAHDAWYEQALADSSDYHSTDSTADAASRAESRRSFMSKERTREYRARQQMLNMLKTGFGRFPDRGPIRRVYTLGASIRLRDDPIVRSGASASNSNTDGSAVLSKTLWLAPRFIVHNATGLTLQLRQLMLKRNVLRSIGVRWGAGDYIPTHEDTLTPTYTLAPDESRPMHWFEWVQPLPGQSAAPRRVTVRLQEQGWQWCAPSNGLPADLVGSFSARMINSYTQQHAVLRVHVKLEQATFVVTFGLELRHLKQFMTDASHKLHRRAAPDSIPVGVDGASSAGGTSSRRSRFGDDRASISGSISSTGTLNADDIKRAAAAIALKTGRAGSMPGDVLTQAETVGYSDDGTPFSENEYVGFGAPSHSQSDWPNRDRNVQPANVTSGSPAPYRIENFSLQPLLVYQKTVGDTNAATLLAYQSAWFAWDEPMLLSSRVVVDAVFLSQTRVIHNHSGQSGSAGECTVRVGTFSLDRIREYGNVTMQVPTLARQDNKAANRYRNGKCTLHIELFVEEDVRVLRISDVSASARRVLSLPDQLRDLTKPKVTTHLLMAFPAIGFSIVTGTPPSQQPANAARGRRSLAGSTGRRVTRNAAHTASDAKHGDADGNSAVGVAMSHRHLPRSSHLVLQSSSYDSTLGFGNSSFSSSFDRSMASSTAAGLPHTHLPFADGGSTVHASMNIVPKRTEVLYVSLTGLEMLVVDRPSAELSVDVLLKHFQVDNPSLRTAFPVVLHPVDTQFADLAQQLHASTFEPQLSRDTTAPATPTAPLDSLGDADGKLAEFLSLLDDPSQECFMRIGLTLNHKLSGRKLLYCPRASLQMNAIGVSVDEPFINDMMWIVSQFSVQPALASQQRLGKHKASSATSHTSAVSHNRGAAYHSERRSNHSQHVPPRAAARAHASHSSDSRFNLYFESLVLHPLIFRITFASQSRLDDNDTDSIDGSTGRKPVHSTAFDSMRNGTDDDDNNDDDDDDDNDDVKLAPRVVTVRAPHRSISSSRSNSGSSSDGNRSATSVQFEYEYNPLRAVLTAIGVSLANIENAPIRLNALQLEHVFAGSTELVAQIVQHYRIALIRQTYRLLGSTDLLGNPVGLLSSVGTGFYEFFYHPALGFVHSPEAFGAGVAKGTLSFFQHSLYGVSNAASRMSESLAKGFSSLVMADSRFFTSAHHQLGLVSGVRYGLQSLVRFPHEGYRVEGIRGLVKGSLRGLASAALLPVIGCLSWAFRVTNATRHMVNPQVLPHRVRYPRILRFNAAIMSYDSFPACVLRVAIEGARFAVSDPSGSSSALHKHARVELDPDADDIQLVVVSSDRTQALMFTRYCILTIELNADIACDSETHDMVTSMFCWRDVDQVMYVNGHVTIAGHSIALEAVPVGYWRRLYYRVARAWSQPTHLRTSRVSTTLTTRAFELIRRPGSMSMQCDSESAAAIYALLATGQFE
jgi:Vacuolar-sorting-associated 13 protein, DH-like domain/Vacuolar sorting-associated protein 13, extended-chorein/VPS13, central RBG modules/Vacuolar-sorting associated protein 13, adaptor binding domain